MLVLKVAFTGGGRQESKNAWKRLLGKSLARLHLVNPESVIEILEYGIIIWWYTSIRKEVVFLNQKIFQQKIFLVPKFLAIFSVLR